MKPLYWKLLPFLVFVLLAVFFLRGLSLNPRELPSVQIGKALPDFSLERLDNETTPFTPKSLKNQVALLNVWASWCASCSEEQVFLMTLAADGIPIYGLNYKDDPSDAAKWLSEWGNPYKMIGEDLDGRVAIDLGVYGAPETFLIDQQGVIQYRHAGPLTEEIWQQAFVPRIQQLEGKSEH